MKSTTLLAVLMTISIGTTFAQNDYIRLRKGKDIEEIRIHEITATYVSYEEKGSLHDVANTDINLIRKKGKLIRFNKKGEIITLEKKIISASEYKEIQETDIEYDNDTLISEEETNNVDSSIAETPEKNRVTEMRKVKYTIIDKSEPEEDEFNSVVDYYELGENDGKEYYNSKGSFTAGYICGLIPGLGLIPTAIIGFIPPSNRGNLENPNLEHFKNEQYKKEYKRAAAKKKLKSTWRGFAAGTGTLLLLVIAL